MRLSNRIVPQIEDALTRKVPVYTVALHVPSLSQVNEWTGRFQWAEALGARDKATLHKKIRVGRGFAECCQNCLQLVGELFGSDDAIIDRGAEYKHPVW